MKKNTFILLALMLIAPRVFAWNGVGHSTGGALTYYLLKKNDPEVLSRALKTLRMHPWYDGRWHLKLAGLTAAEKEVGLFMLASTFPDDARGTPYDHPTWHYVDYPFVPAGQGGSGSQPERPNAEVMIGKLLVALKGDQGSVENALRLCWVLHLVENIHQPLHTAALFTSELKNGDRGGNAVFVKVKAANQPVKLHKFWDDLVKGDFKNAPGRARQLLDEARFAPEQLTELTQNPTLNNWILNESFTIACTVTYQNGTINTDKAHALLLSQDYIDKAGEIALRRIVLSGHRLAALLTNLYAA